MTQTHDDLILYELRRLPLFRWLFGLALPAWIITVLIAGTSKPPNSLFWSEIEFPLGFLFILLFMFRAERMNSCLRSLLFWVLASVSVGLSSKDLWGNLFAISYAILSMCVVVYIVVRLYKMAEKRVPASEDAALNAAQPVSDTGESSQ